MIVGSQPRRCEPPAGRSRGLLFALIAIFCFSPDALFTRLLAVVTPEGTSSTVLILFWKNCIIGVNNLGAAIWLDGGVEPMLAGLASGPSHVAFASLIQCATQIGFTLSFLLCDPATALILVSLNPLWAALLGW